ncbi:unnamed protein product [Rotaria sp. Silwood2]|nr:unnamed protein product [Rotaria sp. Silwood2]CAF4296313.1 unnamed protein product [Rotaria sp. Silwood2]CAF4735880.1 unnamed protein product [Rotaria sp. Silwood2]
MACENLSPSSTDNDFIIDISSSATKRNEKEQLKLKFHLAIIDDIDKNNIKETKEKANKIKILLSKRIDRFTVTAHGITKTHLASWWSNFGFAKENISGETSFVSNFISCQQCFTTFRYGLSSTESIARHQCHGLTSSCNSASNDYSHTLDKHVIKSKTSFRPSKQQYLTKLFSTWISDNLSPISIVEDSGLREICFHFYDLGAKYIGPTMDLQTLFQSRQTISRSISDQAELYRQELIELIREPIKKQSLTLSPDMWLDRYRQLSYLGVTVTFVDANLQFRKFTLCCRSFPIDLGKTGENISRITNSFRGHHFQFVLDLILYDTCPFLRHAITYVPCLQKLAIQYEKLVTVTNKCTNDATQLDCNQSEQTKYLMKYFSIFFV